MTDAEPQSESTESHRDEFTIDFYGIKGPLRPAQEEDQPAGWLDLAKRVNRKLQSIVLNVFGVVDEGLKSVRALVEGVRGRVRQSTGRQIERYHSVADAREDQSQAAVIHGSFSLTPKETEEQLENVLQALHAKGLSAFAREVRPGFYVLVIVPPEMQVMAYECANVEVPLFPNERRSSQRSSVNWVASVQSLESKIRFDANVIDISESGVLFRTDHPEVFSGTPCEILLRRRDGSQVEPFAFGTVVRTALLPDESYGVAVRFDTALFFG